MQMISLPVQQADLVRLLKSSHVQTVIRVINFLLVIWIASLLAAMTWKLLPVEQDGSAASAPPVSGVVRKQESPTRKLIAQIPGWHLFGVAGRDAAPAASATANAPDTSLRLTLSGVLASDNPEEARAIIAGQGKSEEHYRVGDQLPGNAQLSEIHADRVILMRNGRYETLRLPRESSGSSAPASRVSSYQPRSTPRGIQQGGSPAERLAALRKQLKTNPKRLFGLVQTTVRNDESGKPIGYTLSPGRDPELFTELGLQEGDVVVQVNDTRLDDPANSSKALQALESGEQVTLQVLRDGVEQSVVLAVQE